MSFYMKNWTSTSFGQSKGFDLSPARWRRIEAFANLF